MAKIKDKEKLLIAAREKQQITYKGTPIRLTADFSAETLQARREWQDIFKGIKGKTLQPRLLYPAKISFRFDGQIKSDKQIRQIRQANQTSKSDKQIRQIRQANAKRIQHHQTTSTTNAKGASLSGKHKRRKGPTKTNTEGFPGGAVVESLPANAGNTGSSPGLGRSHMPQSNWACEPQLLSLHVWSLCSATRQAAKIGRAHV